MSRPDETTPSQVPTASAPATRDSAAVHRIGRATAHPVRPDPWIWDEPQMRQALYQHDFITVYRLLQRIGYSQNAIGQLTGQSQPEISAILHGRRVISYRVIARIADGLGIPRGYLGLSRCTCT
jgi:Helix-turn-helix domain